MAVVAMITAGGSGSRMHQNIPKQFLTVNERPVIVYTLEVFERHPEIDAIAVACLESWENVLEAYAQQFNITKLKYIVPGGETGQESIKNGLFELEKHFAPNDIVMIHDGNRPMLPPEVISDSLRVVNKNGNAVAAIPCAEVIMETEDGLISTRTHRRETLRRTQTPHSFRLSDICALYRKADDAGIKNCAASCQMMEELGEHVYFSVGSEKNLKLTTLDDIDIFKALLKTERADWLKS
ncbi:MAG: 2-C-methyl-D-erythritol 4-phosphate cytidylyltransferase [Synergistaceae bacterium]|nr:2-C-methyl-D-erythritol 4-phosphate cytidylyltransferase [Synergistaceae bacterium]